MTGQVRRGGEGELKGGLGDDFAFERGHEFRTPIDSLPLSVDPGGDGKGQKEGGDEEEQGAKPAGCGGKYPMHESSVGWQGEGWGGKSR
ncbi:MAG: hypothetical protein FD129_530 [bacterium]|nr:MAG: hypothetical protein FD129_530 [bacterium]